MTSKIRRICFAIICYVVSCLIVDGVAGQDMQRAALGKSTADQKQPNLELARWTVYLNALEQQSRNLGPEERRVYATVDIAVAYWEIDKEETRSMLNATVDSAWNIVKQDKKKRPVLDYVLNTASKLDPKLMRSLQDRLAKKEGGEKERDSIPGKSFYEYLESDPEAAAQILESMAPYGVENGGMAISLLLGLAKKDITLADRVYKVYLTKIAAEKNFSLQGTLPLAGYAFGLSESWTMSRFGDGPGSVWPPVKGLSKNSANMQMFLKIFRDRLAESIARRNDSPGTDAESLSYTILFAVNYLGPDIEQSPPLIADWPELKQQSVVGTTPAQMARVDRYVTQIFEYRKKLQLQDQNPEQWERDLEKSLEDVEKLAGACDRDAVYSKAILSLAYRKQFKRTKELLSRIEDQKQRNVVEQLVLMDQALDHIEKGDFDEAAGLLKKLALPEIKAYVNIKLALAALSKNDRALSDASFDDAVIMAEKATDAKLKTGLLFGAAAARVRSNTPDAKETFEKAIKIFGKLEPSDEFTFSIPVRIPVGCGAEPPIYWADRSLANANVLDAVEIFAANDPDAAGAAVESMPDKITRARAEAIVARAALAKARKLPKPQ